MVLPLHYIIIISFPHEKQTVKLVEEYIRVIRAHDYALQRIPYFLVILSYPGPVMHNNL